jgi:hypothetical protein
MQGIFVNDRRPKSKKEVKEFCLTNPSAVSLEATSFFGNEYDGSLANAPDGTYTFVGPDPARNRKFFGNIVKQHGTIRCT